MISPTVSLDPASDVITDVIRAADPEKAAAAARRLSDVAGQASAPDAGFDAELGRLAARAPPAPGIPAAVKRAAERAAANSKNGQQVEFESMFLGDVLADLLPNDANGFFGEGTAGQMWKSMLADQVARQIAKSGAFDIAGRLFAHGGPDGGEAAGRSMRPWRGIVAPKAGELEITPARKQG